MELGGLTSFARPAPRRIIHIGRNLPNVDTLRARPAAQPCGLRNLDVVPPRQPPAPRIGSGGEPPDLPPPPPHRCSGGLELRWRAPAPHPGGGPGKRRFGGGVGWFYRPRPL